MTWHHHHQHNEEDRERGARHGDGTDEGLLLHLRPGLLNVLFKHCVYIGLMNVYGYIFGLMTDGTLPSVSPNLTSVEEAHGAGGLLGLVFVVRHHHDGTSVVLVQHVKQFHHLCTHL